MTMLDLAKLDLSDLCLALEDNSPEHSWWFDPETGEAELWSDYTGDELGLGHPDDRGLTYIEPIGSPEAYGDMEDFVERVRDPRARDLLARAIEGRGAFRRFKDTLLEYPELRQAWFAFHDARSERRAIEWLLERDLVHPEAAEEALKSRPEPTVPEVPGLLDAHGVAQRVALDLERVYRDRLRGVLLIGAWAGGEAHPESELELLVLLDSVDDRSE